MLTAALFLMLADAPAEKSLADARAIAETGMLATIGDLTTASETEEVLAAHSDLTAAEQGIFRTVARETAAGLHARAVDAAARAYLANLPAAHLAEIAAFTRSEAGRAQRAAMPAIMNATVQGLSAGGPIDYEGETMKVFCAKTGKLCEAK